MNFRISHKLILGCALLVLASCAKKLDRFPAADLTEEQVYATPAGYKGMLAKVYGSMATSGNQGPSGQSDIQGLDEGSQSPFIRGFFNAQELPTDEAIVSWDDQTIKDFHALRFTTTDPFLYGLYSRLTYNVLLCNEYLRQSTDERLAARGISGTDADQIRSSRGEVRFLRAFNYWAVMDIFGKATFITEADEVNGATPREITRANLFTYIETELLDIQNTLPASHTAEYGRVDRGAAWALLARMYLNAQVYTGTARYTDAITYSTKVIGGGYSLYPNNASRGADSTGYRAVFLADNDKAKDEFIYVINCDGIRNPNYGNTSFLIHAPAGDNAQSDYNISDGWKGYRVTRQLVNLFADPSGATDRRAMFYDFGASDITDVGVYAQGVKVKKWRNFRSDGAPVSDATNRSFADNDFPVFRLAEMYLIYAEAVLRGGTGGDPTTALNYVNLLRRRAYGNNSNDLNSINTSIVLDERGRELYWESHRRTDLVRYNLLTTGTYLWQWKGGSQSGTAVDAKYNLFPIPQKAITTNPNLTQNPGY
ncbi:MAG: RagB/SusD family nutrient uptake outer membrane protein [Sphingobacteriales bacterium]|nr:MAG: RagB/SusD family nutrient uptake outer membrane protein [Sphingobacteriales bacterium]